jgi:acyl-homoserine-lactone acylase
MHTSSRADVIDQYLETVVETEDGYYYKYGDELLPFKTTKLSLPYKDGDTLASKEVTVFHSHHGPVIRETDGKWVSVRLMNEPMKALSQSYLRTKASGHAEYYETGRIKTNSSNNTVYADAQGNIAYYHGNFHPRRDLNYDYTKPVDGSDPATEWQGLHPLEEQIILTNPANGWLMNTNNWPFSAAGEFSPRKDDYPVYMSDNRENYRGIHAIKVLEDKKDFTLESLHEAAYDSYLPAFADLIPALLDAYDSFASDHWYKTKLEEQVAALRDWDYRYSEASIPTSLAVTWGQVLMLQSMGKARLQGMDIYEYMIGSTTADQKVFALYTASDKLADNFGDWKTPWCEINRFQRLTGDIVQPFNDDKRSYPVGFASAHWGSLAAYGQRTFNDTRKIYGTRGNSFVAVVEFGDKVRAKAVSAGGQSGDPSSPHFADQAELYASGRLRDVYYYKEDVLKNAEETYQPGRR